MIARILPPSTGSRRVRLRAAATVTICLLLGVATSAYLILGRNAPQRPAQIPSSSLPNVISLDEANHIVKTQWGGKVECSALETFAENVIYPCLDTKGNLRLECHVPHLSFDVADPVIACSSLGARQVQPVHPSVRASPASALQGV